MTSKDSNPRTRTPGSSDAPETAGHTMQQLRLGLPMTAFSEAVLAARDAGEERLYLAVPVDLVQAALRTASPEVAGHSAVGSDEDVVVLELDDTDFDVAGAFQF